MKVTIESTRLIRLVDGVPARVWEGKTEAGVPVTLYIARVQVDESMPLDEFGDLVEGQAPALGPALEVPLPEPPLPPWEGDET